MILIKLEIFSVILWEMTCVDSMFLERFPESGHPQVSCPLADPHLHLVLSVAS